MSSERFTREHYARKATKHAAAAEEKLKLAENCTWGDAARIATVVTAHATLAIYYDRLANG